MILLVEPDTIWQRRLREALEIISDVDSVENGQDALEKIYKTEPLMIIMELALPDMEWRRFHAHLLDSNYLPHMVAVTHEHQLDEVTDVMNLGFGGYFHKPSLNVSELQMKIRSLIQ